MEKIRPAFKSIICTVAALAVLFIFALFLGFEFFGGIFSTAGFIALAFLIFATIAE